MQESTASAEATPAMPSNPRKDDLLKSAQAIAISHNLIQQGLYQGVAAKDISVALSFLETLHKNVMDELGPMMGEVQS